MIRKFILFIFLMLIAILGYSWDLNDYDVKDTEEIQKTLNFTDASKPKTLKLDNVYGSINVAGCKGRDVRLFAKKVILAESKEDMEEAKEEVGLSISNENNNISIIVDGPFRCRNGSVHWDDLGYIVKYDFELKVPYKTGIILKTVNDGDIFIHKIEGDFNVRNVNGKIKITEISGSGKAHTVNGGVKVDFSKNPESDCSFRTINGKLKITFPQKPSADFMLKTFNGEIYSDFSFTYLPMPPSKASKERGKYVYKRNRFGMVRIGKGGLKIKMGTLNGNIYIAGK